MDKEYFHLFIYSFYLIYKKIHYYYNYMLKILIDFFWLAFLSLSPVSLSPITRQTLNHRSASDQAIPATASDGKSTSALLSL